MDDYRNSLTIKFCADFHALISVSATLRTSTIYHVYLLCCVKTNIIRCIKSNVVMLHHVVCVAVKFMTLMAVYDKFHKELLLFNLFYIV